jgi:hypothetical protein
MIPLFLLAGRNNPIIKLTGISFDTMNLIHRWFGRIVILEAIAHTVCWMALKVQTSKSQPYLDSYLSLTTQQRAGPPFRHRSTAAPSS